MTATLFEMTLAPGNEGENKARVAGTPGNKDKNNAQVSVEQRKMFKELKHQIEEFLNTFKGVIPDQELNKRKRVLFTQLRLGKMNGGARNKKQQEQEKEKDAKPAGVETGEFTVTGRMWKVWVQSRKPGVRLDVRPGVVMEK